MDLQGLSEIIDLLNGEIYKQTEHDEISISLLSCSWQITINFLNIQIWSSEDDDREIDDNDNFEDFEIYLRRKIMSELHKISFISL